MSKKKTIWIIIAALFATTIYGALFAALSSSTILLPQASLQNIINRRLPFDAANGVIISGAHIDLGDGTIEISLTAQSSKFGVREVLQGQAKGSLIYQRSGGSFYFELNDIRLTNIEIGALSLPNQLLSIFHKLLAPASADQPTLLKKQVEFIHDSFLDAAQKYLAHTPVYTLPDTLMGRVARIGLRSIRVDHGYLVIHISFFPLT